jgi:hypothetical protein
MPWRHTVDAPLLAMAGSTPLASAGLDGAAAASIRPHQTRELLLPLLEEARLMAEACSGPSCRLQMCRLQQHRDVNFD